MLDALRTSKTCSVVPVSPFCSTISELIVHDLRARFHDAFKALWSRGIYPTSMHPGGGAIQETPVAGRLSTARCEPLTTTQKLCCCLCTHPHTLNQTTMHRVLSLSLTFLGIKAPSLFQLFTGHEPLSFFVCRSLS